MSGCRNPRAWGPGLVALVCIGGIALSRLDPVAPAHDAVAPRTPQLSEEARALLGGLSVGDRIMGWTVQALDGPTDGIIRIDVGRDEVRFALMVVVLGSRPEQPPLQTERHAIFYGHVEPPDIELPNTTIRATTNALARRLRANETEVDVPGM